MLRLKGRARHVPPSSSNRACGRAARSGAALLRAHGSHVALLSDVAGNLPSQVPALLRQQLVPLWDAQTQLKPLPEAQWCLPIHPPPPPRCRLSQRCGLSVSSLRSQRACPAPKLQPAGPCFCNAQLCPSCKADAVKHQSFTVTKRDPQMGLCTPALTGTICVRLSPQPFIRALKSGMRKHGALGQQLKVTNRTTEGPL